MKKILILIGHYVPGYKDGGPVRSIKNLTDRLGDEYCFRILTIDREATDTKPYEGIKVREYNRVGKSEVYYVEPGGMDRHTIESLAADADMVYMCGCFSEYAIPALLANRLGHIPCKFVIASMGLFTPGAFRIKYVKKKIYMTVLRMLGFFKKVEWSATSEEEVIDIKQKVGKRAICHIAEDLPRLVENMPEKTSSEKGNLRVVFLSRISKKKNLSYAAQILAGVKGNITFDIYGNMEDDAYYQECYEQLTKLPANVSWSYKGEADAEQVISVFGSYDVFLFPTLAENFGHVILEAMSAGCIPIISDKTPWTNEKMEFTGHVVSLDEIEEFRDILQKYVDMEKEEIQKKARKTFSFAHKYINENASKAEQAYRNILDE